MKKRKNFPLRISHELYKELQRLADQEMRSVNGQIEFLLHRAVLEAKAKTQNDALDLATEPTEAENSAIEQTEVHDRPVEGEGSGG